MRIVFLGPEEPSFLLSLGGVESVVVKDHRDAYEAVEELLKEEDVGVVLIASGFYTKELLSILPRKGGPIVVPFPASLDEVEGSLEDPQIIQVEKMLGLR